MLFVFSEATSVLVLGALLDVYDKNSWYAKWKNWLIGFVLILPFPIMIIVFNIVYEILFPIMNTPDIVDALFGTLGVVLAYLYFNRVKVKAIIKL